jgi:hypothetical protein
MIQGDTLGHCPIGGDVPIGIVEGMMDDNKETPPGVQRRPTTQAPPPITQLDPAPPQDPVPPDSALTPGLPRATDPVGDNPYSPDTLLHRVWRDATLEAEEAMCRLLQTPRLESPEQFFSHVSRQFDIWAGRGVHVVWSHPALEAYDRWLLVYAQSYFDNVPLPLAGPPDDQAFLGVRDAFKGRFRDVVNARVRYWQAEGRRYLGEQRAQNGGRTNQELILDEVLKAEDPETAVTGTMPEDATSAGLSVGGEHQAVVGSDTATGTVAPPALAPAARATSTAQNILKRRADGYWDVAFGGESGMVKNVGGMTLIWNVLQRPFTLISSAELLGKVVGCVSSDVERIATTSSGEVARLRRHRGHGPDDDSRTDWGETGTAARYKRYAGLDDGEHLRRIREGAPEHGSTMEEADADLGGDLDEVLGRQGRHEAEQEKARLKRERDKLTNMRTIAQETRQLEGLPDLDAKIQACSDGIAQIEKYLKPSQGLCRRERLLNSPTEADRLRARQLYSTALNRLRVVPPLHDHLGRCINPGGSFFYQPNPPVDWQFE